MNTPRTKEIWGAMLYTYPFLINCVNETGELEIELTAAREEIEMLKNAIANNNDAARAEYIELKERRDRLAKALSLAGKLCNVVHHPKSMQHETFDPCPVEALIEKALYKAP